VTSHRMNPYYLLPLLIIIYIVIRLFVWNSNKYSYKCPHCHAEFQPTSLTAYAGPHLIFWRYLRCPRCNKPGWASVVRLK
jgi:DNA-directed RNA polymerase subunit RPC12/RpoP